MLTGDVVEVWRIRLDVPPSVAALLATALSTEERARLHRRSDPTLRRHFAVTHGAVRCILAGYLGTRPHDLRWRTGRWGKPELAGLHRVLRFNLSHSAGLALLAVTGPRDVGVDVERLRSEDEAVSVARRYFPRPEFDRVLSSGPAGRVRTFARLWTRKEACVKASGARLADGLRLPVGVGGTALVRDPSGRLPGLWMLRDVSPSADHVAAVALSGPEPYRVVLRRWTAKLAHAP